MVKEASSVSNFKKLIIPIIALVILAAAYIIIDNLPEKEDETETTEERVEIFNFKKDDLAEIKIEGRDEILWFRYVTIQVEEEETTPDGTVEKKTVDRNVWQAVEPEGMKPNTSTIDNIAWNANTLKAQKVIEESPSELSIYGLDNPVKLTFIMKDGTQNIIDVGNKIPTGGSYYVRKEGDPTVYTIGSYEAEKFLQTKFDLMVKELYEESYTPEDFTAISYERKGAKVFDSASDEKGNWFISYPIETEANSSSIYSILQVLGELTVFEYVEENVEDLNKYGLKNPPYILSYTTKGNNYKLSLGNKTDKGYFYAIMNDENLVFTIPGSNFPFLDKPIEEIISSFIHLQNIADVAEMRIQIDGRTDISKIKVDTEDDEKSTYEFNGTLLTGEKDDQYISAFKKYYQGAIGLIVDKVELDAEPVLENPEVTITYTLHSGEKIVVELVSTPDNIYYYAFKNGEYTGTMLRKKQLDDENRNGLRVTYDMLVEKLKERDEG
jgi:hypothetical protein